MMCALVVRRLKPGAYDHFRRAWEPDAPRHWPAGMTRTWIASADDAPDVIATWSLFDLDEAGYEALRDDHEWMSAELRRAERMSEFEVEILASGYFHVLEEIVPPTVAGASGSVRTATTGDIRLAYETFGDPADAPVLLIMGLATQMLGWPDEFCTALAERGHYVVRFDNRDVGLSTQTTLRACS